MKLLILSVLVFQITFLNKAQPVVYHYRAALFQKEGLERDKKPYLSIRYDGSKTGLCRVAFRVFILKPSDTSNYEPGGHGYLASFVAGQDCKVNFLLPFSDSAPEWKSQDIDFYIIPINLKGKFITANLNKQIQIKTTFH